MKRNRIGQGAPDARGTRALDDDTLSRVSGGLTVATTTMPEPSVGQDVYDWAARVSRYVHAATHGGYGA